MQKYSYHMHTNSFNAYDGRDSVFDMIAKAEALGFEKIGISNHLIFHPNIPNPERMFFSDFNKACDLYKRTIDEIKKVSLNFNIDVKVGFEVDFFPSQSWRNLFEKMQKEISADYYIGATHYLRDKTEEFLMNMYHLRRNPDIKIKDEDLTVYLNIYWDNIVEAIKSGYFNFIAHIDVCKIFGYCLSSEWDNRKLEVIETLSKYNHPYELNTSGWNKVNEQHPHEWMIKELKNRNVPIIISDDAHSTDMIGQHFVKAEDMLLSLNYTNRYCPNFK